jgi:putative salt-induced outer membrane protein YdiY
MTSPPLRPAPLAVSAALAALLLAAAPARAQVTIKPDGQWRHLFGVGASIASGNSDAASVNLSADSVRATEGDKWSLTGRALYSRAEGETTAERVALGTQYNRDISARWFGFGSADALRDRPANLSARGSVAGGVGYHLRPSGSDFWDLSAGLGYTQDRYISPVDVAGALRSRYGRAELVLAEESSSAITATTSLRQKLRLLPNLHDRGEYRAEFESNLVVAINSNLSLNAGLAYRYDSDPGVGLESGDALFITGLSMRID